MAEENQQSLNKEVLLLLGSVGVFLSIGYFLWLPDLINSGLITHNAFVLDTLKSVLIYAYVPAVVYCFIVGELSGNLSQVDKIWSVVPAVFSWYITIYEAQYNGTKLHMKSVLMSVLVTLWGFRLTIKFYFRGGYSLRFWAGDEDYRWVYVRDRLPLLKNSKILMRIFNLGFISLYQIFLLFALSGGVQLGVMALRYQTYSSRHDSYKEVSKADFAVALVMFCLICLETIADSQQQRFQQEKYSRIEEKRSLHCSTHHYEKGFVTNGLFAYSRHPNFACEQAIWLVFYMFSIDFGNLKLFEIGGLVNVSIIGFLLLVILFKQSTILTEDISSGKYPSYKVYQKNVAMFIDFKLVLKKLILGKSPDRNWIKKN